MSYRISIEGVTIGVHYESSAFKCLGCILFLCFEGNWGIVIDERVKSFFDDWLNIISFGNVVARRSIRERREDRSLSFFVSCRGRLFLNIINCTWFLSKVDNIRLKC